LDGERKRVALAAALVRDTDVLILDEPTNHLDLAAIRWLTDLITSQRDVTVENIESVIANKEFYNNILTT
jgi:ATPase subunit of ABC transporter with duplicated ATPase domains